MKQNETLLDIVELLWKWKKSILLATLLSALVAVGCSLTLSNYYSASTQFYAANPDVAMPLPVGGSKNRKYIFGTGDDLDRLFSISKSNQVRSYLTEKYSLYDHYEIDQDDPLSEHKLSLKFARAYDVVKTKYDAIELSFEDKDPVFAAEVANTARDKIDLLAQSIIKETQLIQLSKYDRAIADKEKKYNKLSDSLNYVRDRYGIFSAESQGEAYGTTLVEVEGGYQKTKGTLEYLISANAPQDTIIKITALKRGLKAQLNKLKEDITNYNKGFLISENLANVIEEFSQLLEVDKRLREALAVAVDANTSAIHLIEEATVPVYKSRPKRSLIVIGCALLGFLLSSLWVVIYDQVKKYQASR